MRIYDLGRGLETIRLGENFNRHYAADREGIKHIHVAAIETKFGNPGSKFFPQIPHGQVPQALQKEIVETDVIPEPFYNHPNTNKIAASYRELLECILLISASEDTPFFVRSKKHVRR